MKSQADNMKEIYRLDIGQVRFPTDVDVREHILESVFCHFGLFSSHIVVSNFHPLAVFGQTF